MPVIGFPNTPTNGDELQAPNKFVYEWTDDNRWKNIHRPLVISDYIWPETEPPDDDDPYDDGDPPAEDDPWEDPENPVPGGGGQDWILEAVDLPVYNGEAQIQIELLVNVDTGVLFDPFYNQPVMTHTTDFSDGGTGLTVNETIQPECQAPYIAQTGRSKGGDDRTFMAQASASVPNFVPNPGDTWFSFPNVTAIDFDSLNPACAIDLRLYLSASGLANLGQVRARLTGTINGIGPNFGFYEWLRLGQKDSGGVESPTEHSAYLDLGPVRSPTRGSSAWFYLDDSDPDFHWLVMTGRLGGGYEAGDIVVEIDDPWAPQVRTNLPVGFASNPEHTKSLVTFAGSSGPILRTMHHNDPGRLTNSAYDQTIYGDTVAALTGNPYTDGDFEAIWFREDQGWFCYVDADQPRKVEGRHLYTPGDFTSHSEVVNPNYDYNDYSSLSPTLSADIVDVCMSPDGDNMYVMDTVGDIRSYSLSTSWDLSTAVFVEHLDMSGWGATCFDITQDGYVILLVKADSARQIIMGTPWDLSTSYDSGFQRYFALEGPIGVSVSADMESIFLLDVPVDEAVAYRIYNYTRVK